MLEETLGAALREQTMRMAQVEWKGMCLDVGGMILAWSDDTGLAANTRESECRSAEESQAAAQIPLQRNNDIPLFRLGSNHTCQP